MLTTGTCLAGVVKVGEAEAVPGAAAWLPACPPFVRSRRRRLPSNNASTARISGTESNATKCISDVPGLAARVTPASTACALTPAHRSSTGGSRTRCRIGHQSSSSLRRPLDSEQTEADHRDSFSQQRRAPRRRPATVYRLETHPVASRSAAGRSPRRRRSASKRDPGDRGSGVRLRREMLAVPGLRRVLMLPRRRAQHGSSRINGPGIARPPASPTNLLRAAGFLPPGARRAARPSADSWSTFPPASPGEPASSPAPAHAQAPSDAWTAPPPTPHPQRPDLPTFTRARPENFSGASRNW
jgi:hypothetical protein